jgi:hypothetical protein
MWKNLGRSLAILTGIIPMIAQAQIPRTLSYQGVLSDSLGNPKPDGAYSFTFRLYQASSGGTALWTEQKALLVNRGLFQTALGDVVALGPSIRFDRPYWLGIQVASDPELFPRIPLTSSGYSFSSVRSDTAGYALNAAPFALPYSGTNSGTNDAFSISNSGTGSGVNISLTNAGSGARGINVLHNGVGPGVFATSAGGNALWGITSSISAAGVIGDNTFGEAVVGRNRGGNGVGAVVGRNDSSGYGVRGFNTRSGIGVLGQAGISGGTGVAGKFENVNASNSSDALQVSTNGTGRACLVTAGGTGTFTTAATQVENFKTSGEAVWMRSASASNTAPVIKLHKHPSSSANFVDGLTWDGAGSAVRRFHITSAGTYVAGSDFAEAFEAAGGADTYEPGDVVVLSPDGPRSVEKCTKPYDVRVAGVYSTRPGILGADKGGMTRVDEQDIPVAIVGIVPTKVTNENGPIHQGDLLTTSTLPGYAMKASPVMISGVPIYPTGAIIGKALGTLESDTGLIQVLVTLR